MYNYEQHVVSTNIIVRGSAKAEIYYNTELTCKSCGCIYQADANYGIAFGKEAYVASCPMPRCYTLNFKNTGDVDG